jgi:endonuclease/exonuclease/phosphatase family metal-dependent hydrolase
MAASLRFFIGITTPVLIGVFFCLCCNSCKESRNPTEQWRSAPGAEPQPEQQSARQTPGKSQPATAKVNTAENQTPVRFLAYNLKNYLTMRRYSAGKAVYTKKPEVEIAALIEIIAKAKPDILGVCEIGKQDDLVDFQQRLKDAGVSLPHTHRVYGSDRTRALGLLSRFPIIETNTPRELNYTIENMPFSISRGILDATVKTPRRKLRLLGVHFKSKRPIKDADQALMRRNESLLMREHIKAIMKNNPETHLLAYGDFNDTKKSKSVSSVRGRSNSNSYMKIIELLDQRGESWTHHWKHEDIYSRIDFVMANPKLEPFINKKESKLLDDKNWETASDHRPMLVLID